MDQGLVTDANLGECKRQNQIILSVLARPFVKQTNHFVYHRSNRQNLMVKLIIRWHTAEFFISNLPLANFSFFFPWMKISFVKLYEKLNGSISFLVSNFVVFVFNPGISMDQPVLGPIQPKPLTRWRFLKYSLDDQIHVLQPKHIQETYVELKSHLEQASLLKTSILWLRRNFEYDVIKRDHGSFDWNSHSKVRSDNHYHRGRHFYNF